MDQAIDEILAMGKRMEAKNYVNAVEGNISVKRGGRIYITPTSRDKSELAGEMIAVLDERGNQVGGKFPASSEAAMHVHIYPMRGDIGAVIHCHAPFLTAHAVCHQPVESKAYPEMMTIFKKIDIAPYGTPGSDDIYAGISPLIQKSNVVLLANHGAVCVGKTLNDAFHTLDAAEAVAKVLFLASLLGKPVDLPAEECRMLLGK